MLRGSLEKNLQQARSLVKKQEFEAAHQIYEKLLFSFPKNPRVQTAAKKLENAIGRKSDAAGTVNNHALISRMYELYHSGRFLDLIKIGHGLGDETSVPAEVWNLIGASNKQLGRLNAAVNAFKKAAELDIQNANILNNLGVSLGAIGNHDEALIALEKAICIDKHYAEAHFNLANVLKEQDKLQEASRAYQAAIKNRPDYPQAFNNLGSVYHDAGEVQNAVECYRKAVSFDSNFADAYQNMAVALHDQMNFASAKEAFQKSLDLKCSPEALKNLANLLKDQGYINDAKQCFEKSLELRPDFSEALYDLSLLHLMEHNFDQGFDLYENRWETRQWGSERNFQSIPRWQGQPDKTVLVWAEQGIGDEIMFSSMIPELEKVSSSITVQCDTRLIELFQNSFGNNIRFQGTDEPILKEDYDCQIPMGSLCSFFRSNKSDFLNASTKFLCCDKRKSLELREELKTFGGEYFIGISWKTHARTPRAKFRNIELGALAQDLSSEGIKLVCLQYDVLPDELESVSRQLGIEIIQFSEIDNKNDINGLASLIMACDSVVTIDNSTAHLAGALGQNVKVLLPFVHDWRWGLKDLSSYWYEDVELYRQTKPEDWASALSQLA